MGKKIIQVTYTQKISDERLLDLSKESASVYNKALRIFWKKKNQNVFLSKFSLQKEMSSNYSRGLLHSDSYIASLQQFHAAVICWIRASKEYLKHPEKFTGKPKPPIVEKQVNCITFKQHAIRCKNNFLLLSLSSGNDPIKIRWNKKLGLPIYAIINWNSNFGWLIHIVVEKTIEEASMLQKEKILGVDLGVKRIATVFDGNNCITFSGKYLNSLSRLENKIQGSNQTKLEKLKKHGRQYKKIKRAERKIRFKIRNKEKDFLNKTSRKIVNYAVKNNIGTIVFGDCADIHEKTDCGKNNQIIQQNLEQQLRKYVTYKYESIGGITQVIPENYTSQTCPKCGSRKKDKRIYSCSNSLCGFQYHRDGVGSINIWGLANNVSLGNLPNVVDGLTPPIGVKYKSFQDCLPDSFAIRH